MAKVGGRPARLVMAAVVVFGLSTLGMGGASAHDVGTGWTLTGGHDSTCIKSNGEFKDDHLRTYNRVRFELTVNVGFDKICITKTVSKRYRLRARAWTNGAICWSTAWREGNAGQATTTVSPIQATCGAGNYTFETWGQMQGNNMNWYGSAFMWGNHDLK